MLIERKARFRLVSDLESGIERVAGRFRTFAEAQQSAIEAREAARAEALLLLALI